MTYTPTANCYPPLTNNPVDYYSHQPPARDHLGGDHPVLIGRYMTPDPGKSRPHGERPSCHTHRRSTPPAADDRAGRPGVGSASTLSRLRPQSQKAEAEDAGSPENAEGIFTWWLEAPAQKSNSLRQRPQNVALEAAQVLRCLYLQHPYKMLLRLLDVSQLHVGEGETVHDLRVHGLDLAGTGAGSREPSSRLPPCRRWRQKKRNGLICR